MTGLPSSDVYGLAYFNAYEQKKLEVWVKAAVIPSYEHLAHHMRMDALGSIIVFSQYGDRAADFGWEFDHFPVPAWMGGSDDVSNLRPLHWRNNAVLGPLSGLGSLGNVGR
jgi:hypothetical protein